MPKSTAACLVSVWRAIAKLVKRHFLTFYDTLIEAGGARYAQPSTMPVAKDADQNLSLSRYGSMCTAPHLREAGRCARTRRFLPWISKTTEFVCYCIAGGQPFKTNPRATRACSVYPRETPADTGKDIVLANAVLINIGTPPFNNNMLRALSHAGNPACLGGRDCCTNLGRHKSTNSSSGLESAGVLCAGSDKPQVAWAPPPPSVHLEEKSCLAL